MAQQFNLTAQIQLQAPTNTNQVASQIRKQLGSQVVNVKVQGDAKSLAAIQGQLKGVDKSAKSSAASMNMLNRNIAEAARRFSVITVATGSFIALARAIKNSAGAAIEFEREMVKISQVTGNTVANLKGLANEVTRLSTSLGVANQSLLETARILAQAGFSALKTKQAMEVLAKTTLAPSFDNIIDTTEGAIAVINQFGREARAVGKDIQFLEQALDAINKVSKTFAVEASDLITAVRRTGGVFEAAGGNLNELIALFTSVRQTTRESAETIATGFRTIFTRLQRTETISALEELGIQLSDVEGKFIGPMKAIEALANGLAGLDPRDLRFAEIVEQLGGFRQIGKVIPLIKQYAVAENALAVANTSAGDTAKDAITAQQALSVQFQKVKESFDALMRRFVDSDTFRSVAGTVLEMADAFLKFAKSLEDVLPLLASLAAIKIGRALAPGLVGLMGGGGGGARGRQFGGVVRGFARGGWVPGTGNRDTVPAMLTPGEFVIKKSSAAKLGPSALEAMNKNRFKTGTEVKEEAALTRAKLAESGVTGSYKVGDVADQKLQTGKIATTILKASGDDDPADRTLEVAGAFLQPQDIEEMSVASIDRTAFIDAAKKGLGGGRGGGKHSDISRDMAAQFGDIADQIKVGIEGGSLQQEVATAFQKRMRQKMAEGGKEIATENSMGWFNQQRFKDGFNRANMEQAEGAMFEGFINGLATGAFSQTKGNPNDPFDFPSGLGGAYDEFGLDASTKPTDAKRTFHGGSMVSISKKAANLLYNAAQAKIATAIDLGQAGTGGGSDAAKRRQKAQKRAMGGSVSGKDSVPSLLTPGEFVINKSSAESIGYSNLNRMNQTGVARFAAGGAVGGIQFLTGGGLSQTQKTSDLSSFAHSAPQAAAAIAAFTQSTNEAHAAMMSYQGVIKRGGTEGEALNAASRAVEQIMLQLQPEYKDAVDKNKLLTEEQDQLSDQTRLLTAEMKHEEQALKQKAEIDKRYRAYRAQGMKAMDARNKAIADQVKQDGILLQTKARVNAALNSQASGAAGGAGGAGGAAGGAGGGGGMMMPDTSKLQKGLGMASKGLTMFGQGLNKMNGVFSRVSSTLMMVTFMAGTLVQAMGGMSDAQKEQEQAGIAAAGAHLAIIAEIVSFGMQMAAATVLIGANVAAKAQEAAGSAMAFLADNAEALSSFAAGDADLFETLGSLLAGKADTAEAVASGGAAVMDTAEAGGSALATTADTAEAAASFAALKAAALEAGAELLGVKAETLETAINLAAVAAEGLEIVANIAAAASEVIETVANLASAASEVIETAANLASAASETVETVANIAAAASEGLETVANLASATSEMIEAAANIASAGSEVVETVANLASAASEGIETVANLASASSEAIETVANIASASSEIVETMANLASAASEGVETLANLASAASEVIETGANLASAGSEVIETAANVASAASELAETAANIAATAATVALTVALLALTAATLAATVGVAALVVTSVAASASLAVLTVAAVATSVAAVVLSVGLLAAAASAVVLTGTNLIASVSSGILAVANLAAAASAAILGASSLIASAAIVGGSVVATGSLLILSAAAMVTAVALFAITAGVAALVVAMALIGVASGGIAAAFGMTALAAAGQAVAMVANTVAAAASAMAQTALSVASAIAGSAMLANAVATIGNVVATGMAVLARVAEIAAVVASTVANLAQTVSSAMATAANFIQSASSAIVSLANTVQAGVTALLSINFLALLTAGLGLVLAKMAELAATALNAVATGLSAVAAGLRAAADFASSAASALYAGSTLAAAVASIALTVSAVGAAAANTLNAVATAANTVTTAIQTVVQGAYITAVAASVAVVAAAIVAKVGEIAASVIAAVANIAQAASSAIATIGNLAQAASAAVSAIANFAQSAAAALSAIAMGGLSVSIVISIPAILANAAANIGNAIVTAVNAAVTAFNAITTAAAAVASAARAVADFFSAGGAFVKGMADIGGAIASGFSAVMSLLQGASSGAAAAGNLTLAGAGMAAAVALLPLAKIALAVAAALAMLFAPIIALAALIAAALAGALVGFVASIYETTKATTALRQSMDQFNKAADDAIERLRAGEGGSEQDFVDARQGAAVSEFNKNLLETRKYTLAMNNAMTTAGKAAGGAAAGMIAFGAIGFAVGGPLGMLAGIITGAVIGATVGMTSALEDAREEIKKQVEAERARAELVARISNLYATTTWRAVKATMAFDKMMQDAEKSGMSAVDTLRQLGQGTGNLGTEIGSARGRMDEASGRADSLQSILEAKGLVTAGGETIGEGDTQQQKQDLAEYKELTKQRDEAMKAYNDMLKKYLAQEAGLRRQIQNAFGEVIKAIAEQEGAFKNVNLVDMVDMGDLLGADAGLALAYKRAIKEIDKIIEEEYRASIEEARKAGDAPLEAALTKKRDLRKAEADLNVEKAATERLLAEKKAAAAILRTEVIERAKQRAMEDAITTLKAFNSVLLGSTQTARLMAAIDPAIAIANMEGPDAATFDATALDVPLMEINPKILSDTIDQALTGIELGIGSQAPAGDPVDKGIQDMGKRMKDRVMVIQDVIDKIPTALGGVFKIPKAEGERKNMVTDLYDQLNASVGGALSGPGMEGISEVVRQRIQEMVDSGEPITTDKLQDMMGDLEEIGEKQLEALRRSIEVQNKYLTDMDKINSAIIDMQGKYADSLANVVDVQNKARDRMLGAAEGSQIGGYTPAQLRGQRQRGERGRRTAASARLGVDARGAGAIAGDVRATSQALKDLQAEAKRNAALAQTETDPLRKAKFNENAKRAAAAAKRAAGELERLSDQAERAAALEAELNAVRAGRDQKRGVLEDFAFGGDEERVDMATAFQDVQLAIGQGNMRGATEEQRANISDMLGRLSDVEIGNTGMTGAQIKAELGTQELIDQGFPPDVAKQLAEADPREIQLLEELNQIGKEEKAAAEALAQAQFDQVTELQAIRDALTAAFPVDINTAMRNALQSADKPQKDAQDEKLRLDLKAMQDSIDATAKKLAELNAAIETVRKDLLAQSDEVDALQDPEAQAARREEQQREFNESAQGDSLQGLRNVATMFTAAEGDSSEFMVAQERGAREQAVVEGMTGEDATSFSDHLLEMRGLGGRGDWDRTSSDILGEGGWGGNTALSDMSTDDLEAGVRASLENAFQLAMSKAHGEDARAGVMASYEATVKRVMDAFAHMSDEEKDAAGSYGVAGHGKVFGEAIANVFIPQVEQALKQGNIVPSEMNRGGMVAYRSGGGILGSIFKPRGTDTVPAMLTPGEFVVRKSAVDKIGLGTLSAINQGKGFSSGGVVYRAGGGPIGLPEQGAATTAFFGAVAQGNKKNVLEALSHGYGLNMGEANKAFKALVKLYKDGKLDVSKIQGPQELDDVIEVFRQASRLSKVDKTGATFRPIVPDVTGLERMADTFTAHGTPDAVDDLIPPDQVSKMAVAVGKFEAGQASLVQTNMQATKAMQNVAVGGTNGAHFAAKLIELAGLSDGNVYDNLGAVQTSISKRQQEELKEVTELKELFAKTGEVTKQITYAGLTGGVGVGAVDYGGDISTDAARTSWNTLLEKMGAAVEAAEEAKAEEAKEQKIADEAQAREGMDKKQEMAYNFLRDLGILRLARGGSVSSGLDSVPAMLTPGEFVMNAGAVKKHGVQAMRQLNRGRVPGFNKGGLVGGGVAYRANGSSGPEGGGSASISIDSSNLQGVLTDFGASFQSHLDGVVQKLSGFSGATDRLATAIETGMTITHNFTGDMTMAFSIENGDHLKTLIAEAVTPTIVSQVTEVINEKFEKDFRAGG